MEIVTRLKSTAKSKIDFLVSYCSQLDNRKTAFAIASAICIGITPLVGFTFLLAASFGMVFRLNQVIMQAVHVIVSPLQILLFYPFIKAGKSIFGLNHNFSISVDQLPAYIMNHTRDFFQAYFKMFMAGMVVWGIISIVVGFVLYKVLSFYISRYQLSCCKA